MKTLLFATRALVVALLTIMTAPLLAQPVQSTNPQPSIEAATMTEPWMTTPYADADGTSRTLALEFPGKAIVVVNTASRCGYTKQYDGLEALYQQHKDAGLVVVAFPSNDFGGQEPGTDAEILTFCQTKFNVTFPIKRKMPTKGDAKSPLYAALTGPGSPTPGEVAWNFEKFVIARDGRIVARFPSKVTPESDELKQAVTKALATPATK